EVLSQFSGGRIALFWLKGHRFEADGLQGSWDAAIDGARRRECPLLHPLDHIGLVSANERHLSGKQGIKRRPKAVDVATRTYEIPSPGALLGTNVAGCPDRRPKDGVHRAAAR